MRKLDVIGNISLGMSRFNHNSSSSKSYGRLKMTKNHFLNSVNFFQIFSFLPKMNIFSFLAYSLLFQIVICFNIYHWDHSPSNKISFTKQRIVTSSSTLNKQKQVTTCLLIVYKVLGREFVS